MLAEQVQVQVGQELVVVPLAEALAAVVLARERVQGQVLVQEAVPHERRLLPLRLFERLLGPQLVSALLPYERLLEVAVVLLLVQQLV